MAKRSKKKRRKKPRPAPTSSPAPQQTRAPEAAAAPGLGVPSALVANALILVTLLVVLVLRATSSDLYYRSVQEDEILEWATFWAFVAAGIGLALGAFYQFRATRKIPWFLAGVSLFCFVVAGEEISWAQRVFSFRPPEYFLEKNFQQELNVHNVMSTGLRKLAFKMVTLGYGVVLPVLALIPAFRQRFERMAIVAPPWVLIPSFLTSYFVYDQRPWSFTGEWVELMLGLGFLFAAIAAVREFGTAPPAPRKLPRALVLVIASWLLVLGLGTVNAAITRSQRTDDPALLEAARVELEALKRDWLKDGKIRSRCSKHKRVFSYMEKYGGSDLFEGEFAALTAQGLPEERADYFLDPWNYAYWIRDRCSKSKRRRLTVLYSFGPNQIRDSTRWEILGDDIAVFVLRQGLDD